MMIIKNYFFFIS